MFLELFYEYEFMFFVIGMINEDKVGILGRRGG